MPMKIIFSLLSLAFLAAPLCAVYAEDTPTIPTKVSCDTIKNAYGTIDSALGDKKKGVGKQQPQGGIPGMPPGAIPGMGTIPGAGGPPAKQPKGQTGKSVKEDQSWGVAKDSSTDTQPAKKKKAKKKKAEPVSEYKFKQETVSDSTYKFDKRANPIIKDAKPKKKAKKKVVKQETPSEEPPPVDGPPIPQKKLPAQPPQDEFID